MKKMVIPPQAVVHYNVSQRVWRTLNAQWKYFFALKYIQKYIQNQIFLINDFGRNKIEPVVHTHYNFLNNQCPFSTTPKIWLMQVFMGRHETKKN